MNVQHLLYFLCSKHTERLQLSQKDMRSEYTFYMQCMGAQTEREVVSRGVPPQCLQEAELSSVCSFDLCFFSTLQINNIQYNLGVN